ncbi:MAG: histidine phosphatase family protein [Gemmatimonadota bacterium]
MTDTTPIRPGSHVRRVVLALTVAAHAAVFAALPIPVDAQSPPAGGVAEPTVVYLVRHAERAEDGTDDPPISQAGQARARLVAHLLADAGVERIHATRYRRARSTAAPLAEALGLEVAHYDAEDLNAFAARLRAEGGRHLVVGHSNTTPELVTALGGDPGASIHEAEYDRLYILTLTPGMTSTVLLRFGAAPPF